MRGNWLSNNGLDVLLVHYLPLLIVVVEHLLVVVWFLSKYVNASRVAAVLVLLDQLVEL